MMVQYHVGRYRVMVQYHIGRYRVINSHRYASPVQHRCRYSGRSVRSSCMCWWVASAETSWQTQCAPFVRSCWQCLQLWCASSACILLAECPRPPAVTIPGHEGHSYSVSCRLNERVLPVNGLVADWVKDGLGVYRYKVYNYSNNCWHCGLRVVWRCISISIICGSVRVVWFEGVR